MLMGSPSAHLTKIDICERRCILPAYPGRLLDILDYDICTAWIGWRGGCTRPDDLEKPRRAISPGLFLND